jgi:hypothetical protein
MAETSFDPSQGHTGIAEDETRGDMAGKLGWLGPPRGQEIATPGRGSEDESRAQICEAFRVELV